MLQPCGVPRESGHSREAAALSTIPMPTAPHWRGSQAGLSGGRRPPWPVAWPGLVNASLPLTAPPGEHRFIRSAIEIAGFEISLFRYAARNDQRKGCGQGRNHFEFSKPCSKIIPHDRLRAKFMSFAPLRRARKFGRFFGAKFKCEIEDVRWQFWATRASRLTARRANR